MTPRERIRAARRLHDPSHKEPPAGLREALLALFLLGLAAGTTLGPGVVAEIGSIALLDWQLGSALLVLIGALNGWALLGVRAMGAQTRLMHVLIALIISYQIADLSITQLGLSASRLAFIALCALKVARTITRPNDTEKIQALERKVRAELEG